MSVFGNTGGNYMTSLATGKKEFGAQETWGGRLGLLYTPSDTVTAYLTLDYMRDTSPNGPLRPVSYRGSRGPLDPEPLPCTLFGYCSSYNKYENEATFLDRPTSRSFGTSLNIDIDLGSATLTSVTGYRRTRENINEDLDGLPVTIIHVVDRLTKQYALSEELRLASNGNRPLSYVFGGIVSRSKFDLVQPLALAGALAGLPSPFIATSAAGTGHEKLCRVRPGVVQAHRCLERHRRRAADV